MKTFFNFPKFSFNHILFWVTDISKRKNHKPNSEKGSKTIKNPLTNPSGKRKIIMVGRGKMAWKDAD